MDENENVEIKENGELTGFDEVDSNYTPPAETEQQGYTVTPEGGFYTKQRQDIIQDEAIGTSATPPPAETEPPHVNFRPNGSYGAQQGERYSRAQYGSYADVLNGRSPDYRTPKREKTPKPKNRYSAAVVVVAAILAAVIGAVSGVTAVILTGGDEKSQQVTSSGTGPSNVNINIDKTVESVAEAVAEKASPSVVGIRTTTSVTSFFGGSNEATGEGSGVIFSADGYIVTNYHVIESAIESSSRSRIDVFLGSDTEEAHEATVIGYNISSDLAVIKIEAAGLVPVEIGNSDDLKVGQYVITIGNPGGLEFMDSVTYGVISGLNRVVSSDSGVRLIQTDAAINPGNSGGALLNTSGQLIGINSSKIVSTEFEGMGFSIPVNTVVEKCQKIINRQNEPEPYIGISFSKTYTAEVLTYLGYPSGAVVSSVDEDSPAAEAGIRRSDILTEFNGHEVTSVSLLGELISECEPGSTVSVKLYRSGRYYSAGITVGSNNAH